VLSSFGVAFVVAAMPRSTDQADVPVRRVYPLAAVAIVLCTTSRRSIAVARVAIVIVVIVVVVVVVVVHCRVVVVVERTKETRRVRNHFENLFEFSTDKTKIKN
jgi:Flp pilus assembly protein TadB